MVKKYTLAAILINFFVISFILLFIGLVTIRNLNTLTIISIFILFIGILLFIIKSYLSTNNFVYNIGIFVTLLTSIIMIYNIVYLNNKYSYIENIYSNKYTYETYNIYVRKSNTVYNNVSKLKGKKIGMLSNNQESIKEYLKDLENINYYEYDDINNLIKAIEGGEIQSLIISKEDYQKYSNDYLKYKVKAIYTGQIKKS